MKCDWCPPKWYTQFPDCLKVYPGRCETKNPGNLQELHYLARRIMPNFFDGIELDYVHRLASNKCLTGNWVLSHTRPGGFRIGGIYTRLVHNNVLQTPTIHADINPSTLASNLGILYYPFNCFRMEAYLQRALDNSSIMTQATFELTRPCYTLTTNLYNLRSDSGRSTLSFMRSITDHLAIGAELLLEWTQPKYLMADTAFAARYAQHSYAVAATASRQGLDVSYWQRLHEKIQMATTFAWNRNTEKSFAIVSYQFDFDDAIVRGMMDSDLSVGFMYQRNLPHMPFGLGISLLMSLPTNRFIFGLKFTLDPSGLRRDDQPITSLKI